ncbi:MAG TPA: hypothetical protein VNO26_09260 [Candidatus Limnocylindria bacterium]|nr:hypothetical protein [Candidatus Limnocylindria bacterium]
MRAGVLTAALVWLLAASGCVVEGTLDAAGGGTLELRYRLVSIANLEQMKSRLASPDVTVTDATMTPDKHATFRVAFRDVRTLPTAPALAATQVALTDDAGGLRTLTVTLPGRQGELPAPYVAYLGGQLRVTVTLPGEIVDSNATSTSGRSATWVRAIAEVEREPSTVFRVTYRQPA